MAATGGLTFAAPSVQQFGPTGLSNPPPLSGASLMVDTPAPLLSSLKPPTDKSPHILQSSPPIYRSHARFSTLFDNDSLDQGPTPKDVLVTVAKYDEAETDPDWYLVSYSEAPYPPERPVKRRLSFSPSAKQLFSSSRQLSSLPSKQSISSKATQVAQPSKLNTSGVALPRSESMAAVDPQASGLGPKRSFLKRLKSHNSPQPPPSVPEPAPSLPTFEMNERPLSIGLNSGGFAAPVVTAGISDRSNAGAIGRPNVNNGLYLAAGSVSQGHGGEQLSESLSSPLAHRGMTSLPPGAAPPPTSPSRPWGESSRQAPSAYSPPPQSTGNGFQVIGRSRDDGRYNGNVSPPGAGQAARAVANARSPPPPPMSYPAQPQMYSQPPNAPPNMTQGRLHSPPINKPQPHTPPVAALASPPLPLSPGDQGQSSYFPRQPQTYSRPPLLDGQATPRAAGASSQGAPPTPPQKSQPNHNFPSAAAQFAAQAQYKQQLHQKQLQQQMEHQKLQQSAASKDGHGVDTVGPLPNGAGLGQSQPNSAAPNGTPSQQHMQSVPNRRQSLNAAAANTAPSQFSAANFRPSPTPPPGGSAPGPVQSQVQPGQVMPQPNVRQQQPNARQQQPNAHHQQLNAHQQQPNVQQAPNVHQRQLLSSLPTRSSSTRLAKPRSAAVPHQPAAPAATQEQPMVPTPVKPLPVNPVAKTLPQNPIAKNLPPVAKDLPASPERNKLPALAIPAPRQQQAAATSSFPPVPANAMADTPTRATPKLAVAAEVAVATAGIAGAAAVAKAATSLPDTEKKAPPLTINTGLKDKPTQQAAADSRNADVQVHATRETAAPNAYGDLGKGVPSQMASRNVSQNSRPEASTSLPSGNATFSPSSPRHSRVTEISEGVRSRTSSGHTPSPLSSANIVDGQSHVRQASSTSSRTSVMERPRPKRKDPRTLTFLLSHPRIMSGLLPHLNINTFLNLLGSDEKMRQNMTGEMVGRWVMREWGVSVDRERGRSWPGLRVWEGFLESLLHDPAVYSTYPAQYYNLLRHLSLSHSLIVLFLRTLPVSAFPFAPPLPFDDDLQYPTLHKSGSAGSLQSMNATRGSELGRMPRRERVTEVVMPEPLSATPHDSNQTVSSVFGVSDPIGGSKKLKRRGSSGSTTSSAFMGLGRRRSNSTSSPAAFSAVKGPATPVPQGKAVLPPVSYPTAKRYEFRRHGGTSLMSPSTAPSSRAPSIMSVQSNVRQGRGTQSSLGHVMSDSGHGGDLPVPPPIGSRGGGHGSVASSDHSTHGSAANSPVFGGRRHGSGSPSSNREAPGSAASARIEPNFDRPPPYMAGRAPILRVFVPISERVPRWPSAQAAMASWAELEKCGASKRMRLGDLVVNTALNKPNNTEHVLVYVPNTQYKLLPLEYEHSPTGHLPRYIDAFTLSPAFYDPFLGLPQILYLNMAPFAQQAMRSLRLAFDRRDVIVASGARLSAKRYLHVAGLDITAADNVAPEWHGMISLEAEGTAEGKAEMEARFGHGDPSRVVIGAWEVVRERSMIGHIWLRLVRPKSAAKTNI